MSEDINSITVVGNLVRNAELKYTTSGSAVTNMSIASNRSKKQGDDWVQEVSYFDVVGFGRRYEALNQYLNKGIKIAVTGYLKQERWQDRNTNDNRSKIIIVANNIQLLGGNQSNNNQGNNSYNNNSNSYKNNSQGNNNYRQSNNGQGNSGGYQNNNGGNNGFEDDIPF